MWGRDRLIGPQNSVKSVWEQRIQADRFQQFENFRFDILATGDLMKIEWAFQMMPDGRVELSVHQETRGRSARRSTAR
jgi:hypothetical protein